MKLAINGIPKKGEEKAIRDIIDKLLTEKFSSWKFSFEDGKGMSI
jgi:hypothetical protein